MYAIRRYVNLKQFAKFEQYGRLAGIGQNLTSSNHTNRSFYTYSPEPSQPINRDPTFCSIEDAVKCVKSGNENKKDTKNIHSHAYKSCVVCAMALCVLVPTKV